MKKKYKKKVFLGLINYGTQAGMFARGLRKHGWDAVSFVWEDPFEREIDHNIEKEFSKNKIIKRFQYFCFFFKNFSKYDIFHFFYGYSILPHNMDLPLYKLFGKKVAMEYLGTDVDLWLGYNGVDWRNRPVDRVKLVKKIKRQSKLVGVQLVCTPHHYQFVDNSIIIPITIDIEKYTPVFKEPDLNNLTLMHCPTNRIGKKTKEIEDAINRLKEEGYCFNYKCVENVTHDQLKEEYKKADIVIDQLNAWYGTVSVEAMAMGKPVVCGIHPHYIQYDERYKDLPIIQADVKNIYYVIKDILDGKYDLRKIGDDSRRFVKRVHALDAVTEQLIGIYERL